MKQLLIAACALALAPAAALAQHYGPPGGGHGGSAPAHGAAAHGAPTMRGGPPMRGGPSRGGAPGAGGRGGGGPVYHPRYGAGPIGRFTTRDLATWRGGYWWHGWRGGRLGWWWFVDGFWYWYAAPAYPYPLYVPDYYVAGENPVPSGPMWYYCANPRGYYPYVRACAGPWRAVPAAPPPPP